MNPRSFPLLSFLAVALIVPSACKKGGDSNSKVKTGTETETETPDPSTNTGMENRLYLPMVAANTQDDPTGGGGEDQPFMPTPEQEAQLRNWIDTHALNCAGGGGCSFAFHDTGAHGLVATSTANRDVPVTATSMPPAVAGNSSLIYGWDFDTPRSFLSSIKFMIAGYGVKLGVSDSATLVEGDGCSNFLESKRKALVDSDNDATACLMSYISKQINATDQNNQTEINSAVKSLTEHFLNVGMIMATTTEEFETKSHFCRWRGPRYKHYYAGHRNGEDALHFNKLTVYDAITYLLNIKNDWSQPKYDSRLLTPATQDKSGLARGSDTTDGSGMRVAHKIGFDSPGHRSDIALFLTFGHIIAASVILERGTTEASVLELQINKMGCAIRRFYLGLPYEVCGDLVAAADVQGASETALRDAP